MTALSGKSYRNGSKWSNRARLDRSLMAAEDVSVVRAARGMRKEMENRGKLELTAVDILDEPCR